MTKIILSGVTAYISTSIDYLVILMIVFGRLKKSKAFTYVYLGDILGTTILVCTALTVSLVLGLIPEPWILGLLGFIPIIMGIMVLVTDEDDGEGSVDRQLHVNGKTRIIIDVATITVITCGADNIGIYVPFFVTLTTNQLIVVLITFFFMMTLFCIMGYFFGKIPLIAKAFDKYGRWITAAVYILLGLSIVYENGTFAKLISFL
ncbi:cadmium resistance transporter [Dellaglioa sp. BT-FLS60]